MPLLQGQPFKLISGLENINNESEIYTIGHTGEKFQNKKDYEDRLALYSQNIWTCQCTGKGCMTHQEAWISESSVKVSAKAAIPAPLHKPLLMLVHHSLSPLDQLVDAASILCYSQFHLGEDLTYSPDGIAVRVIKVKDAPRLILQANGPPGNSNHGNGDIGQPQYPILNGTSNGISNPIDSSTEDQIAHQVREEASNKREMLPRLYTVLCLENNVVIEDVLPGKLIRVFKVPSKDQLRLFIRSCALRHRGSTCTPWMVTEDLLLYHGIANKLPSLFLGAKPATPPQKRKKSITNEALKKFKPDQSNSLKVSHVSKNFPKSNGGKNISRMFGQKDPKLLSKSSNSGNRSLPLLYPSANSGNSSSNSIKSLMPIPKLTSSAIHGLKVPKKRGRPRLSAEEKERNKKLRQATLLQVTGSLTGCAKFIKVKTKSTEDFIPEIPSLLQQLPAGLSSPYKSPLKRANTPDTLMKLPLMRRLVHEYKTIKGVMGQYRRMAYTMDLVLGKLTPAQIELIPDVALKNDLYLRQQKVANKILLNNMTPEERKEYMKKKAREVALERWKERKLKNLKIEDKTLEDLKPLPLPQLVFTPEGVDNSQFGDVVMITEFIKCYRELLLGEEKFKITSVNLMEALTSKQLGYKVIADILCCLLPAIIHDDTGKHCKDLGLPISAIPINYQTAPELARLCLKKHDFDDLVSRDSDEYEQIGREETELSDEILIELESSELWDLAPSEVISVLTALVHKALGCSSLNAFMEETEEKLSTAFREKRIVLKKLAKERMEEHQKKRADKKPKGSLPKRQRGRPKGYSPKIGGNIQEFYEKLKQKEAEANRPMVDSVLQRRKSAEATKKEKEAHELLEKERQKQLEDDSKKRVVERKYDDLLNKRDNLLRRQPIGYDRDHNRYWIFHTSTPGLYVEMGWVDPNTNCQFLQKDVNVSGEWTTATTSNLNPDLKRVDAESKEIPKIERNNSEFSDSAVPVEETLHESSSYEGVGCLSNAQVVSKPIDVLKTEDNSAESDDDRPLSIVTPEKFYEDEKPISIVKTKLSNDDDENKNISSVKSKLTLSPMKMANRGRPPKEAYVLVDEDTQTFPNVQTNSWHCYLSMDDINYLLEALSDKGQRESQLLASININKDRLQLHYNIKPEAMKSLNNTAEWVKISLKEDIIQIERELIEGWLGGIVKFDEWEAKVKECISVHSLGELLIEAQKCMQLKFLKQLMAPVKKLLIADNPDVTPEYEDVEDTGVTRWREAVLSCATYSRMHVLVGMFDSSIKWERSMATRKCKVCRSKQKDDPLLMCEKCESSYHTYCLRPPLKGEIPDSWLCPMCVPKKVRREKEDIEVEEQDDPDEKDDPTFSVSRCERACKKKSIKSTPKVETAEKKVEPECCICWGRIGLIFCSKCSTAYHSECHEPPLQSRARKDWVCATCINSKNSNSKLKADKPEAPTMRRNVFGDLEEIIPKEKKYSNLLQRNISGKFVKKEIEAESESLMEDFNEVSIDEGQGKIRGAKSKALAKVEGFGSRRSGRNTNRKIYSYESDEEISGSSDLDEDVDGAVIHPSQSERVIEDDDSDSVDSEGEYADKTQDTNVTFDETEEYNVTYDEVEESNVTYQEDEAEESNVTYNEDEVEESNVTYNEDEFEENQSLDEASDQDGSENMQEDYSDDQLEISQEMSEEESEFPLT